VGVSEIVVLFGASLEEEEEEEGSKDYRYKNS
jgi:hypothetical protein